MSDLTEVIIYINNSITEPKIRELVLQYFIRSFSSQGLKVFHVFLDNEQNHLAKSLEEKKLPNIQINIEASHNLGTGGAVKKIVERSSNNQFLFVNGDTISEIDIFSFMNFSKKNVSIALKYFDNTSDSTYIEIDSCYKVTSFFDKNSSKDGYTHSGITYLTGEIKKHWPNQDSFSFEDELLPKLLQDNKLIGLPMGGKSLKTSLITDPAILQSSLQQFSLNLKDQPGALFLDRDGVIIKDTKYPHKISDIYIQHDIEPLIKLANKHNMPVIMVTNQSGIGRGFFTVDDCNKVNDFIVSELAKKNAIINDINICPFHPTEAIKPFLKKSLLRKPNPGMHLKAQEKFSIDIRKSFMVGDNLSDTIQMPGLTNLLIQGENDLSQASNPKYVFSNFKELTNYIEKYINQNYGG